MNKYRVRVTHEDRGSCAKYFGSPDIEEWEILND